MRSTYRRDNVVLCPLQGPHDDVQYNCFRYCCHLVSTKVGSEDDVLLLRFGATEKTRTSSGTHEHLFWGKHFHVASILGYLRAHNSVLHRRDRDWEVPLGEFLRTSESLSSLSYVALADDFILLPLDSLGWRWAFGSEIINHPTSKF